MQHVCIFPAGLLVAVSVLSSACADNRANTDPVRGPTPLTNSPAARETANSSTADLADASVELSPTRGNSAAGQLRFTVEGGGVHIMGTVTGLAPDSTHAIHIHEKGDCSAADASSAGGHFNPLGKPHGSPGPETHVGDLGNIIANDAGVAYVDVPAPGATLHTGAATDISGRAVVVHAKPDDLKSQPSGNAGSRIACGVIEPSDDSGGSAPKDTGTTPRQNMPRQ